MASNARQNVKNRVEGIVTDALNVPQPHPPAKPSANAVLEHFLDIPLLDTLNRINAQVGGLQKQLTKVDFHVASALNPPSLAGDDSKQPSSSQIQAAMGAAAGESSTFLTGLDIGITPQEPPSKSRPLIDASPSQLVMRGGFKESKSVEHLLVPEPFPGTDSLELPGKLSANDLIKRVGDRWSTGKGKEHAVWSQCLASKEAQNLVKDLFWWFYCQIYQSGKKSAEQEIIFKRMACNFVRLLTQVPHVQKDRFFDRFHSIMANSAYVAYRVALPESEVQFDEKFRSEICRLAAYWTTGADIGPSSYVLPNGQVVKEDTGSEEIENVILHLVREQAELEEMTDKRPNRHRGGQMASVAASRSAGGATALGGQLGSKGSIRAGSHAGSSLDTPSTSRGRMGGRKGSAGPAAHTSGLKGSPNTGAARYAAGSASASGIKDKAMPVPPLRLPVMKHIAQQATPHAIWSERGTQRSCVPDVLAPTRQVAATSRTAQRPPAGSTGDPLRATTVEELWPRRASTSRDNTTHSHPPLYPLYSPTSARPSSSSTRPSHRQLAIGAKKSAAPAALKSSGKQKKSQYFDLRETSPFIRYYLTTQVTSAATARPEWKQLLSDNVIFAWNRPVPATAAEPKNKKLKEGGRRGLGEEEEEEEEQNLMDKVSLTPREISEAAVKKNQRMVREYRKRALMRGSSIRNERRKMHDFYTEQRAEMKSITNSQERSHIFSNLLVSTGGDNKNFELAWKKMGKDATKDLAD